jgi:hypothetical protein
MMKLQIRFIPFIALAILALLFAMWAGLLRLGWSLPTMPNLALAHGPLMICGFLGVLLPLERAVAIGQKWMFVVPVLLGLGWIGAHLSPSLGIVLFTLGSVGTLAILGVMVKREPHMHTITMAAGALAWVIGNVLWMFGFPIYQILLWWMSFLILTIGGERLELNRVLHPAQGQKMTFGIFGAALLAAALLAAFNMNWGARLGGLSMLALSLWFMRNDLARCNICHPNALTRYIAICLFSGFIWLGLGGLIPLYFGAQYAGPLYDAAVHAVFVGFVISMIFGHAPIIFPAILGVPITFHRAFYGHLILLHLSLILRITGDLFALPVFRNWGGLLNEVAILLFLGLTIHSLMKGRK